MSQIEQNFREFLNKHPEIEKTYATGLINRRALARYLIKQNLAKNNQMEAVVAMLRRYPFERYRLDKFDIIKQIRISIKDKILILDFDKDKTLIKKLEHIISNIDYDKGETFKIVVGEGCVKVFVDEEKESLLKEIIEQFKCRRLKNISEINILFPKKTDKVKGIISYITSELALNDINVTEFLTATPELLIYVEEKYVLKAYEVIKRMQK